MKLCKAVCCIATMAILTLGGCATFPDPSNPEARSIADEIHSDLNAYTKITIDQDDASGRLLRAYFFIAVFSIYGNASIERYSHSPSGDAGALLGRTMAAEAALQEALENIDRNYFPVDRARLTYAVADLAARAVRPTTRMAIGLLGTTPAACANVAVDIFRNAVENKVFGDAYLEGFRRSLCRLNAVADKGRDCKPSPLSAELVLVPGAASRLDTAAWTDLNDILKETCEKLKVKARLEANKDMQCGRVKPVAKPAAKRAPAGGCGQRKRASNDGRNGNGQG